MLKIGELVMDEQGRIGVRRVVSLEAGVANVEQTFEAVGTFRDARYGTIGTCRSRLRSDGSIHADWQGGLRTLDGNGTAMWRGLSVGTFVGAPDHSRIFRGVLTIENGSGKLAELNGVLAASELEIDGEGNVRHRAWRLDSAVGSHS